MTQFEERIKRLRRIGSLIRIADVVSHEAHAQRWLAWIEPYPAIPTGWRVRRRDGRSMVYQREGDAIQAVKHLLDDNENAVRYA